jgi:hypothetical protein
MDLIWTLVVIPLILWALGMLGAVGSLMAGYRYYLDIAKSYRRTFHIIE